MPLIGGIEAKEGVEREVDAEGLGWKGKASLPMEGMQPGGLNRSTLTER